MIHEEYYAALKTIYVDNINQLEYLLQNVETSPVPDKELSDWIANQKSTFSQTSYQIATKIIFSEESEIAEVKQTMIDKAHLLKWFIPLKAIEKEFDILEHKGIYIDRLSHINLSLKNSACAKMTSDLRIR